MMRIAKPIALGLLVLIVVCISYVLGRINGYSEGTAVVTPLAYASVSGYEARNLSMILNALHEQKEDVVVDFFRNRFESALEDYYEVKDKEIRQDSFYKNFNYYKYLGEPDLSGAARYVRKYVPTEKVQESEVYSRVLRENAESN